MEYAGYTACYGLKAIAILFLTLWSIILFAFVVKSFISPIKFSFFLIRQLLGLPKLLLVLLLLLFLGLPCDLYDYLSHKLNGQKTAVTDPAPSTADTELAEDDEEEDPVPVLDNFEPEEECPVQVLDNFTTCRQQFDFSVITTCEIKPEFKTIVAVTPAKEVKPKSALLPFILLLIANAKSSVLDFCLQLVCSIWSIISYCTKIVQGFAKTSRQRLYLTSLVTFAALIILLQIIFQQVAKCVSVLVSAISFLFDLYAATSTSPLLLSSSTPVIATPGRITTAQSTPTAVIVDDQVQQESVAPVNNVVSPIPAIPVIARPSIKQPTRYKSERIHGFYTREDFSRLKNSHRELRTRLSKYEDDEGRKVESDDTKIQLEHEKSLAEVKALQQQIKNVQLDREQVTISLKTLTGENQTLAQEHEALDKKNGELELQAKKHKKEITKVNEDHYKIVFRMKAANDSVEVCTKCDHLEKKLDDIRIEYDQLKEKPERISDAVLADFEQLKTEFADVSSKCQILEDAETARHDALMDKLSGDDFDDEAIIENRDRTILESANKIGELEEQVKNLESDLKSAPTLIEELQTENQDLRTQVNTYKNSAVVVDKVDSKVASELQAEIQRLNTHIQNDIRLTLEDGRSLEKKYEDMKVECEIAANNSEKLRILEQQHQELERQKQHLAQQNHELRVALPSPGSESSENVQLIQNLRTELNAANQNVQQLSIGAQTLEQTTQGLRSQIDQLQQQVVVIDELKNQNTSLKQQVGSIEKLQTQNKDLQHQLTAANDTNEGQARNLEKLLQKVQETNDNESWYDELNNSLFKMQGEINMLKGNIKQHEKSIDEHKQTIGDRNGTIAEQDTRIHQDGLVIADLKNELLGELDDHKGAIADLKEELQDDFNFKMQTLLAEQRAHDEQASVGAAMLQTSKIQKLEEDVDNYASRLELQEKLINETEVKQYEAEAQLQQARNDCKQAKQELDHWSNESGRLDQHVAIRDEIIVKLEAEIQATEGIKQNDSERVGELEFLQQKIVLQREDFTKRLDAHIEATDKAANKASRHAKMLEGQRDHEWRQCAGRQQEIDRLQALLKAPRDHLMLEFDGRLNASAKALKQEQIQRMSAVDRAAREAEKSLKASKRVAELEKELKSFELASNGSGPARVPRSDPVSPIAFKGTPSNVFQKNSILASTLKSQNEDLVRANEALQIAHEAAERENKLNVNRVTDLSGQIRLLREQNEQYKSQFPPSTIQGIKRTNDEAYDVEMTNPSAAPVDAAVELLESSDNPVEVAFTPGRPLAKATGITDVHKSNPLAVNPFAHLSTPTSVIRDDGQERSSKQFRIEISDDEVVGPPTSPAKRR